MKFVLVSLTAMALVLPSSVSAPAHHAEMCKTMAAKQGSKAKRVKIAKNCLAGRSHDREQAKR
jgi:hypothetical protein